MCGHGQNGISERETLGRRRRERNVHRRVLVSRNGLAESHRSGRRLEADDSRLPPNGGVVLEVARVGTGAKGGLGLGPQKAGRLRIQSCSR